MHQWKQAKSCWQSKRDLQVSVVYVSLMGWLQLWDRLGPGTLCCSACTWTKISSSNKIQRNYKGLKITVMGSWGKLWTARYKKDQKNPTAASEEPGAKGGDWEQKQDTIQAVCTKPSLPPEPWTHPSPHPMWGTSLTPLGKWARELLPVLALPNAAGTPINPCLNFLSGL